MHSEQEEVTCFMVNVDETSQYTGHNQKKRPRDDEDEYELNEERPINRRLTGSDYLKYLGPAPGDSDQEIDVSDLDETLKDVTQISAYWNDTDDDWRLEDKYLPDNPEEPKQDNLGPLGKDGVTTTAYTFSKTEIDELYKVSIKLKHVIAGQLITSGGSKCTDSCDTETHHCHRYRKLCKRHLYYGTVADD